MTRLLCLAAFLSLPASTASARDSLWLLCTGTGTETVKADDGSPMVPFEATLSCKDMSVYGED